MVRFYRPESYRVPLFAALERIIRGLGWSKETAAIELGVNRPKLISYINGTREMPFRFIEAIRHKTGIDPYLLAMRMHNELQGRQPYLSDEAWEALVTLTDLYERDLQIRERLRQRF